MVNGNVAAFLLALIGSRFGTTKSFVSIAPTAARPTATLQTSPLSQQTISLLDQDEAYADSFNVIDSCAASGQPSDQLYDSVRYIDKNALKLYPDESAKNELWDRAHGSWKLQLATGGGRYTIFKPVPIFAYAMIDDRCFGNGVGFNQDKIILSLLGPHYFNAKRRQMGIGIEDVYLFSKEVTQFVPGFMAEGMALGKTPDNYVESKSRMPTFTIIGASDKSLIARGGTGGIAIWTRLENDIRPAAYGMMNINGNS